MKLRYPDLQDQTINPEHEALGIPPVEYAVTHAGEHPVLRIAGYLVVTFLIGMAAYLLYRLFGQNGVSSGVDLVRDALQSPVFWSALAVGLLAQIVDGALGMAYGITSSSFLLAAGVSPAMASGATHLAEVFTTGVSGISHLKLGNVDRRLFLSLLLPGIAGALIGTWVLTNIDGKTLKPFVTGYLLLMGLYVLSKAFRKRAAARQISAARVAPLALVGGLMDTTGGGGWGPIVTTSLVGAGQDPRTTIGSVNLAEFFLTLSVAAAFFAVLDHSVWLIVAGLTVGGLFAAPFAALITRHLKTRTLLILVGSLISAISVFNLSRML
ncbi:sulfite exporter TauE/SafE family protein [Viridibacterium curvum]|uniref:Probable membrane transporter protein n=1 Tax=Viridibacterium curvum TaxID=1101404 RepID=A0ABP9QA31_9RHOO